MIIILTNVNTNTNITTTTTTTTTATTTTTGINSRDGLNILHDGGWIDIDEENTPDPTPTVEIGLERSWLSHSVWLYPGECAIYTHVSYLY